MVRGLRAGAPKPAELAGSDVRPWQHDNFSREICPQAWRRVHRNAAILQWLGFLQAKEKPWLFLYRLATGCGVVFANFGSTEAVALLEDTSALIHWRLNECSEVEEHELIGQVLKTCRTAGAEVRVSFYNRHFDQ